MLKRTWTSLLTIVIILQQAFVYANMGSNFFVNQGVDVLSSFAHAYYRYAVTGDAVMIRQLIEQGYPIDIEDEYGYSALCQTAIKNNKDAFSLLKSFGANEQAVCMQVVPLEQKELLMNAAKDVAIRPSPLSGLWGYRALLGTAAVLGAVGIGAALANGGGSSGGGSGGGGGGENPPDPDVVISSPDNPNSAVFNTAEYSFQNNDRMNQALNAANTYADYITVTGNPLSPTYDFSTLATVTVAVTDSGIKDHVDVNIVRNDDGTILRLNPGSSLYETENHGTLVSGLIAGKWDNQGMHGIAPNAQVLDWSLNNNMTFSATLDMLQGAIDANTRIVNMSLGFSSWTADQVTADVDYVFVSENFGFQMANFIKYIAGTTGLSTEPVIWVLSAGNDGLTQPQFLAGLPALSDYYGKDTDDPEHDHGGGIADHANISNLQIVAVSTDLNGTAEKNYLDSNIAAYSNHCGVAKEYCLAAPVGGNMFSDPSVSSTTGTNEYEEFIGTSAAAPIISGVAAFLMGAFPSLTAQEVVEIMFRTALGMEGSSCEGLTGETCSDDIFGRGMVNLNGAMSPIGETSLPKGLSTKKDLVSLKGTTMSIPRIYSLQILSQLPQTISFLDEYARSFQISTDKLIATTHRSQDVFERHFKSFAQMHKIQHIQDDQMNFAYAFSDTSSLSNIGFARVEIPVTDQFSTTLSYQEDTRIHGTSYLDRASSNPFIAMKDAYGISNALSLTQRLVTAVSFISGSNGFVDGDSLLGSAYDGDTYSFLTETTYQLTDFITIKAVGGMLKESGSVLGWNGQQGFEMNGAETAFIGSVLEINPHKKIKLIGSYYYGFSDAQRFNSFLTMSDLKSDSFAFDTRYQWDDRTTFGLMVASPLRVHQGSATFDLPLGRDDQQDLVHRGQYKVDLKPSAREYNISTYYMKQFKHAMFRNEFGMRLNPDHDQEAKTDYRVLMGLDFLF